MKQSCYDARIAVVIPAYNAATYLDESLDSVMVQSENNLEIWVVDDGSTDETPNLLINRKDTVHSIRIDNSGGPSRPRNVGIKQSSAPFVAFFDADDVMLPEKLEKSVDAIVQYPSVGLLFTDFCTINSAGQRTNDSYLHEYTNFRESLVPTEIDGVYLLPAEHAYYHLLNANFVGTSSVVCPRNTLDLMGDFDETMKNADDIDMWRRIARGGWDFLFLDRTMHCYRMGLNSISTRGVSRFPAMIKGLEMQLDHLDDNENIKIVHVRLGKLYRMFGFALRKAKQFSEARSAYSQSLLYHRKLSAYKGWVLALLGK